MVHVGLRKAHRLHNDLINLILDSIHCLQAKVVREFFQYKLIGTLATLIVSRRIVILYECSRFFIDGVVCQVHAQIIQVARGWTLVFDSGETGETILVNIDSQG